MKLVFFCNYLNHHQVLVADALFDILGENYAFVATKPASPALLKGGADYSVSRSYCIRAYEGGPALEKAILLAREAEVCVFGADAMIFAVERAKSVSSKSSQLSFEIAERWLKKGLLNFASPRLLKWLYYYHKYYKKAGFYRLCASAYTKVDDKTLHAYDNRWYKWGYFTKTNSLCEEPQGSHDLPTSVNKQSVRIMWCGRFLAWKHPEHAVMMANKLRNKGYEFRLEIYGDEGNAAKHDSVFPREKLKRLIKDMALGDYVQLMGNRPNAEIIQSMQHNSIFIFSSDKNEGWGAVANESMANGCVLVASDAIGSSPYLIKDGYNGFMYRSCDVDSLTEKVEWLINHPEERIQMQRNAHKSMNELWSPQVAAENLLTLIDCLKNDLETSIQEGPCSKA